MATLPVAINTQLKVATATLKDIEDAVVANTDQSFRPHLGASQIGDDCMAKLWYGFRLATPSNFDGRMLRLFARGQDEEARFVKLLRDAKIEVVEVDHNTGKQYTYRKGHFGGSMDAACKGLREAPTTWHVVEMKTHGEKSFKELIAKGVESAKPEHYAQMLVYMKFTGMTRALYMAVNKNTDELHLERIDFDKQRAEALFDKAHTIIFAQERPARLSEDPTYYKCKWCDHASKCHGTDTALPTCRSCVFGAPTQEGGWSCARHQNDVPFESQVKGCDGHIYHPAFLANWAEPCGGDDTQMWLEYENKLTGKIFRTGSLGYSSKEIHACSDKKAIGDAGVDNLRQQMGAEIIG